MPLRSDVSMRNQPRFDPQEIISNLDSDEPLPDDNPRTRNGGLDPSRKEDLSQIQFYANARQSGAISDKAWLRLIKRNPRSATLFSTVGINPEIAVQRQRSNILPQYFQPEQAGMTPITPRDDEGNVNTVIPPVEGKADVQGAVLSLLSKGDVAGAKELLSLRGQKGESSLFAKINPKDYTQQSIARFEKTERFADLTPAKDKDDPDRTDKLLTHAKNLRNEFNDLSKQYIQVRDSYGRITESAKNPSAAGDLALIFNYMKMLDPGSTVREGEFATAENSAGVPERVKAMYNKTIAGERLSDPTRNDFVGRAKSLYERQRQTHKKLETQYGALAKRVGVNSDLVVTDFELEPLKEKSEAKTSSREKPALGNWTNEKEKRYQELLRKRNAQ